MGCSDAVFQAILARYLLLPQPALRHLTDTVIPNCAFPCDPFGFALCAANLEGGGWTAHHDDIKHAFAHIARDAGLHVSMENTALFLRGLTSAQAQQVGEEFYARGRGYIPDLQIRLRDAAANPPRFLDRLFDVKTLHVRQDPSVPTAYSSARTVDARADSVHGQIERNLRLADFHFFDTPYTSAGSMGDGPLTRKLNSFGQVSGLVFGGIGEASKDVQRLVDRISDHAAHAMAARRGRVDMPSAVAEARAYNRERIAMANLKGMAELLLNRAEFLTVPGPTRWEQHDPRNLLVTDWHSAFNHMHRAATHAERRRAARGSFFSRAR